MEPTHDTNKVDPKQVYKLYDQGLLPSQVSVACGISLHEVIEILDKRRKDALLKERQ